MAIGSTAGYPMGANMGYGYPNLSAYPGVQGSPLIGYTGGMGQMMGSPYGMSASSPFGMSMGSPYGMSASSPYGMSMGSPYGMSASSPFGMSMAPSYGASSLPTSSFPASIASTGGYPPGFLIGANISQGTGYPPVSGGQTAAPQQTSPYGMSTSGQPPLLAGFGAPVGTPSSMMGSSSGSSSGMMMSGFPDIPQSSYYMSSGYGMPASSQYASPLMASFGAPVGTPTRSASAYPSMSNSMYGQSTGLDPFSALMMMGAAAQNGLGATTTQASTSVDPTASLLGGSASGGTDISNMLMSLLSSLLSMSNTTAGQTTA